MSHALCAPACALLDLPDVQVLAVDRGSRSFTLTVETVPAVVGCPSCGVLVTGHGRRQVLLHDLPCAGVAGTCRLAQGIHRCWEAACEVTTFSEVRELATPWGKLTTGADALGVDEHVWRHVGLPSTGLVTGIVDHSRGEDGRPLARLLDLVKGRTGAAHGDWLTEQGSTFTSGIRTATLGPFHGYANTIRDELPEAITVLDAFHVFKLGGQVVDEVARRVQQDTLGHRGRAGDPL